jgi:hypothetical protein
MSVIFYIKSGIADTVKKKMAFREKSAWISLITYTLVFGGYFATVWRVWDESWGRGQSLGLMVGAIVALVILAIIFNTALALFFPRDADTRADEREVLIDLKAERIASYTLSALLVCVVATLIVGWNPYLVANLLMGAMVIAEVVKDIAQIVYFRRGA